MEENQKRCEAEVLRLHTHHDAVVEVLEKIKKKHENTLRDTLKSINAEVDKTRSSLVAKKKGILQRVKSLRENISTMTDDILIKTHRELTKLLSAEDSDTENCFYSLEHERGKIEVVVLESMFGEIRNSSLMI